MSPAVNSSAREASEFTDDPTVVVPTQTQSENVNQPSENLPGKEAVEEGGGTQDPPLKDGNSESDMKHEDDAEFDPDDSFGPPLPPNMVPKGRIGPPVSGGGGGDKNDKKPGPKSDTKSDTSPKPKPKPDPKSDTKPAPGPRR